MGKGVSRWEKGGPCGKGGVRVGKGVSGGTGPAEGCCPAEGWGSGRGGGVSGVLSQEERSVQAGRLPCRGLLPCRAVCSCRRDPLIAPVSPQLPPAALSRVRPRGTVRDEPSLGHKRPRELRRPLPLGAVPAGAAHAVLRVRPGSGRDCGDSGERRCRLWVTLGRACTHSCP